MIYRGTGFLAAPRPPPSPYSPVCLPVCRRRERGGGVELNHATARKLGPLEKSFNPLCTWHICSRPFCLDKHFLWRHLLQAQRCKNNIFSTFQGLTQGCGSWIRMRFRILRFRMPPLCKKIINIILILNCKKVVFYSWEICWRKEYFWCVLTDIFLKLSGSVCGIRIRILSYLKRPDSEVYVFFNWHLQHMWKPNFFCQNYKIFP